MKNQLAGLMKQAQTMQDNMKKMQEQLASIEVEGQSGAGMGKVVMTCKNDVKRVTIDPSLQYCPRSAQKEATFLALAIAPRQGTPTPSLFSARWRIPAKLVVAKILAPLGLKSATDIGVQRRSWAMPDARRTSSLERLLCRVGYQAWRSRPFLRLLNPS